MSAFAWGMVAGAFTTFAGIAFGYGWAAVCDWRRKSQPELSRLGSTPETPEMSGPPPLVNVVPYQGYRLLIVPANFAALTVDEYLKAGLAVNAQADAILWNGTVHHCDRHPDGSVSVELP